MPNNGQESSEVRAYRFIQFQQSLMWKNHKCDLCGGFANQCHEIIFRSETVNNAEARRLSFQKELTALLCERCHSSAHTEATSLQLLKKNIEVYGYEQVEDALALLKAELRGDIMLIMPKREESHE